MCVRPSVRVRVRVCGKRMINHSANSVRVRVSVSGKRIINHSANADPDDNDEPNNNTKTMTNYHKIVDN